MHRRAVVVACVIAVARGGIAIRLFLLGASQAGFLNADEAYAGIQTRRIAEGDRPIILRGIGYTSTIDGYVIAPFVQIIGGAASLFKFVASIWYAGTAVLLVLVLRRFTMDLRISRNTVIAAASALWLLPGAMMVLSLRPYMAYGSLPLFSTLLLWPSLDVTRHRLIMRRALVTGALAGFLFYLHPMMIASALAMLLTPTWVHRRQVVGWWLPVATAALIVNIPLLVYNARNYWPTFTPPPGEGSYLSRLWGITSELWPRSFGLMHLDGAWLLGGFGLVLFIGLLGLAAVGIYHLIAQGPIGWALAVPATATWPLFALLSSSAFVSDGRYTTVGYVPLVVVIAVGGHAAVTAISRRVRATHTMQALLATTMCTAWIAVLGMAWWSDNAGPRVDDPNARLREATTVISDAGISHVAGNFWHVLPIEFLSDGDIHAAVAGHPWGAYLDWRPNLPWAVMFPERQIEVAEQPDDAVAFVFEAGDEQVGVMRRPSADYQRIAIGPTIVYLPAWDT